uniref:Vitellogenin-1 n=1 Tax=Ornithodoros moubata TaxID=6938 RepID=A0A1Z5KZW8_ORNMO
MEQRVSGVSISSKIIVQPQGRYLVFKPEHVLFDKVHQDVENFEIFNYRTIEELSSNFTTPFKVFYEHGKVRNIQIGRTEPLPLSRSSTSTARCVTSRSVAPNPCGLST